MIMTLLSAIGAMVVIVLLVIGVNTVVETLKQKDKK